MSDETYDDGAIEPAPKDDNEGPTVRHPDAVGDDPVEDSGVAEDETATEPEPEAPAEVPAGDADPEAEAAAAEEPDEE